MDVTASITLTAEEKRDLANILGCPQTQLATKLQPYAAAALGEYVSMCLGQRVFKRGSDIHEYRLFLLIQKVFGNKIPGEEDVCRLFQTTATESRSLIRSVMSKYQYKLKGATESSMKQVIQQAAQPNNEEGATYEVTINSDNVVDELNRLLANLDGTLQPVRKKPRSVTTYLISPSSYEKLSNHFEL